MSSENNLQFMEIYKLEFIEQLFHKPRVSKGSGAPFGGVFRGNAPESLSAESEILLGAAAPPEKRI